MSEEAIKQRILTHMNADHADSLCLYLQHYCAVPASSCPPSKIKLVDITTSHLIITSPVGRNVIPIDPPMKSFSESREKMVSMHRECLAGLDLSDVVVDRWVPPAKLWQWALLFLTAWCFTTFPFRESVHPDANTVFSKGWSLGGSAPGLGLLAYKLATPVLWFMIVIHALETGIFIQKRLRRHQTYSKGGTVVWWAWVANVFCSGIATFKRFDEYVEEKKKSLEAKKH